MDFGPTARAANSGGRRQQLPLEIARKIGDPPFVHANKDLVHTGSIPVPGSYRSISLPYFANE